ncbi:MAG: nicotinate phosphoribosyltransferase [Candidatus Puniceispirillales bacterium]
MSKLPNSGPTPENQPSRTDSYFLRTKAVVEKSGESQVTYAFFMRRPVLSAPRLAIEWLTSMAEARGIKIDVEINHEEGGWVGAGEPIFFLRGSLSQIVDLETVMLQRLGAASVAAYNAFAMCNSLPNVSFLAMDARHCAGGEMAELMAYGASVGSRMAREKAGAIGFIGCATDHTAPFFGSDKGKGTMPHALIGYAGSTVAAAQLYHDTFPDEPLTVLVDYFGQEITDGLAVAKAFPELAKAGRLALRLDTHGGRYVEGLDVQESYAVLERNAADAIRGYRNDQELKFLIGTGVSAAATWHLRESLDDAGFDKVRIVCSSGFGPEKCRVFALAGTPVDVIGTGSYLPEKWSETYATADIIDYDGQSRVKTGREFLIPEKGRD